MGTICVRGEDGDVIATVDYNNVLDRWNGHNYCRGVGRHLGLTQLEDGRYVLIHGTNWVGEDDWAEVVTSKQAMQEWLKGGQPSGFAELKALASATLAREARTEEQGEQQE